MSAANERKWTGMGNEKCSGEWRVTSKMSALSGSRCEGKKAVVRNAVVSGKWLVVRVTSEKCKGMWYGVRGEKLRHCEWTPINENQ